VAERSAVKMSRREFLMASGSAGLYVFFALNKPPLSEAAPVPPFGGRLPPDDFNAYLRVGADGRTVCYVGKVEMGQGVYTSLQQMLADELDVALESVDIVMGDTALCPWDIGTFGSLSTRQFGPLLRKAGAEARQALIELAAERWGAPPARLAAEDGAVFDPAVRSRRAAYAELTGGKKFERKPAGAVRLKTPAQFKIMGRSAPRKDGVQKVTGAAVYAADVSLPGMLYAKILRPPAHGAKLLDADVSEAEKVPGVQVVREKDFVAVLHEDPETARAALARIKARFSGSPSTCDEVSIFDHLLKNAPEPTSVVERGDVDRGRQAAATRSSSVYYNDYVAHAAVETHAAVVRIEDGEAAVWASTQTPFMAQEQVAAELGFDKEKVRVMPLFVGGGFGGKSAGLQTVEAARCARLSGKPVQVCWTREEEFFNDTFRPAAVVKVDSGLDGDGRISFWDQHVYYAGDRGADFFYDAPNVRVLSHGAVFERGAHRPSAHPFPVGPWRAPGNNTNTFARESQMDLLAERAKADPVEFRLRHLSDEKRRGVLKTAAEIFRWQAGKTPGAGRGVACGFDAGTFVAMMAEVEVGRAAGGVQVKRIVCVQDMGMVVSPRGATVQMEGAITMGLGYALRELVHFKDGRILDLNFGTYQIPRFSWLPVIETRIVENQFSDAQGGGEPPIVTVGAALANAVYDAVGARLDRLPMTPERVLAALTPR
jgi:nicotinate dehydrogenase subunit B